jgi:hypothetical protein
LALSKQLDAINFLFNWDDDVDGVADHAGLGFLALGSLGHGLSMACVGAERERLTLWRRFERAFGFVAVLSGTGFLVLAGISLYWSHLALSTGFLGLLITGAAGIDTSTSTGKAMYQMVGVFAELERAIIRERVMAGLARARAQGTKLGRRPVSATVERDIRRALSKGDLGIRKIARIVGVGVGTVQRVKAAMRP